MQFKKVNKRCIDLGMDIKIYDMANIYATIPGYERLPAIMMGSHIDYVKQGGNYDGILNEKCFRNIYLSMFLKHFLSIQ